MGFIQGAPRSAWLWFADELALGSWLLPVVPDENATPTPESKVAKFGKVPSLYDSQGLAHGLSKWTARPAASGAELDRWSRDGRYSLCIRTGSGSGLYALDIDVPDASASARIADLFRARVGSFCRERYRSNSGKCLLAFRIGESPFLSKRSFKCNGGIVEFLADGQQFVASGPHPSGAQYDWRGGLPDDFGEVTAEEFEAAWSAVEQEFSLDPIGEHSTDGTVRGEVGTVNEIGVEELSELEDILKFKPLIDAADLNDTWAEVGYGLLTLGGTGLSLWQEFSARVDAARGSPRRHSAVEWWAGHIDGATRTDWRHIFTMAKRLGWGSVASPDAFEPIAKDVPRDITDLLDGSPGLDDKGSVPTAHHLCTDQANARRIEHAFGSKLISVADSFYTYTGTHWSRNESAVSRMCAELSSIVSTEAQFARDLAKNLEGTLTADLGEWLTSRLRHCREASDPKRNKSYKELAADPRTRMLMIQMGTADDLSKWAKQCEMKQTQQNCLTLLRALLNLDAARLDSHAHLLNCATGTIDLRDGAIRAHDPRDYITQLAPVPYEPTAKADRFRSFLVEILDEERATFLQRWFGYCATGETKEQKILLHVGQGSNGKSSLFRTLKDVLGGYMHTAAPHLLTGKASDRHPTEIADLFGRRCVVTHESEEGAQLREGFIKQASGEDQMSARLLYKDFFTFQPTFKLQLLTNHKPIVKGSDYAIWRRLLLCWFNHRYGTQQDIDDKRADRLGDPDLYKQLQGEREGVLAWIVEGAKLWYAQGLKVPRSIVEASEAYRQAEDRVAEFVRERCILDSSAWTPYGGASGLYMDYSRWCRECGYQPLAMRRFATELSRVTGSTESESDRRKVVVDGIRKSAAGCYGIRVNPDGDGGGEVIGNVGDLL